MLKAVNGETMSGLEVFSAAINFLKKHFIENVNNRIVGNDITVESVRWVLTVPAIWSDSAKQFMRESAEKVNSCCFPNLTSFTRQPLNYEFLMILFENKEVFSYRMKKTKHLRREILP